MESATYKYESAILEGQLPWCVSKRPLPSTLRIRECHTVMRETCFMGMPRSLGPPVEEASRRAIVLQTTEEARADVDADADDDADGGLRLFNVSDGRSRVSPECRQRARRARSAVRGKSMVPRGRPQTCIPPPSVSTSATRDEMTTTIMHVRIECAGPPLGLQRHLSCHVSWNVLAQATT